MKITKILIVILSFILVSMTFGCSCSKNQELAVDLSENTSIQEEQKDNVNESSMPKSEEINNVDELKNINSTDEYITSNKNNFFLTSKEAQIGDEVTLTLSLVGNVSICRYSIQITYDNVVLKLIDYDAELGAFSPVVYPQKDDYGNVIDNTNGTINLEWANATNIKKEGKIIELVFKVRNISVAKTEVCITVNGVNYILDSTVVEAEYSVKNAVITIK